MATSDAAPATHDAVSDRSQAAATPEPPVAESPRKRLARLNDESALPPLPATPTKGVDKPLPKEPTTSVTPRPAKKKVPWKGKNIIVLLPRDNERGLPGHPPRPLRQEEIGRMFSSWEELGYDISGFDLDVDGVQPVGSADSQTRDTWPDPVDVSTERITEHSTKAYKVTLPDLKKWENEMMELQEAKLRALGVSFGDDEPAPPPSISPATTDPSRQPSAQYPPLPFSPPLPTSSASSSHGLPGFPLQNQFIPGHSSATQSPALPAGSSPSPFGAPGKYNPRQSISLPASASPFGGPQQHQQGWPSQAGILHGLNRNDSPSMMNLNGILSPSSPFGNENPSFPVHQRHQSLQYPMLPHQQFSFLQPARASPRLQEIGEDDEEMVNKSPSKTPEPPKMNPDQLQAEIEEAEYHLEEKLRNELEHEDYNPPKTEPPADISEPFVPGHESEASGSFPVPEHFAQEPAKPLVLHHPRPHSRGHSLSQNFFRDHSDAQEAAAEEVSNLSNLNEIPESHKADESFEIETNPSNLGTPVQNFEFPSAAALGHSKNLSTTSNPWTDNASATSGGARRSSHASKPSLSKLNVQAPEFKFNPASTFTPGQFDFSSNQDFQPTSFQPASFQPPSFQPTIFQAGGFQPGASSFNPLASPPSEHSSTFGLPATFGVNAPSFSPGQSDFSFSALGPKFNPDAPSFTPLSDSFTSLSGSGTSHKKHESIFGNIDLSKSSLAKPRKVSKAIPIIRPISRDAKQENEETEASEKDMPVDQNGRLSNDESRIKRARSQAPGGDDVPLFAEQPQDTAASQEPEKEEAPSAAEDKPADGETSFPVDTSMSSVNSGQMDTKATTATPSEVSPLEEQTNRWKPFEFDTKDEVRDFDSARPFGEDTFKHGHKKTLSATAAAFTPGAGSYGGEMYTDQDDTGEFSVSPVESPVAPPKPAAGIASSRFSSQQSQPRTVSGLSASRFADPTAKPKGLAASRYARSPTPEQQQQQMPDEISADDVIQSVEKEPETEALIDFEQPRQAPADGGKPASPTMEEIDAVMDEFLMDPSMGVNRRVEVQPPKWQQHASPTRNLSVAAVANSSPYRLEPAVEQFTREDASLTPREYHALPTAPAEPMLTTELEDPFVDPPSTMRTPDNAGAADDGESLPASDWEAAFTEDEHEKLENRAQFFDGRVNEVVGALLASRLEPLEKALFTIQDNLAPRSRRTPSSRRDMRSVSAELQQSDADDEDEEPVIRRSMSPRRDRRLDQIRIAVQDGLAANQRNQLNSLPVPQGEAAPPLAVLEAIEDLKRNFAANNTMGENLKAIVAEAVKNNVPTQSAEIDAEHPKILEMQAKHEDLEQRLYFEQSKVENEMAERRAAEDLAAELNRKLQAAETRVEVEIINRSVFDQRVTDLEEKLKNQELIAEEAVQAKRMAQDSLKDSQHMYENAAAEAERYKESLEQKEQSLQKLEQSSSKSAMRMALLEAAQSNATQSHSEQATKITALETDLREIRQDNHHYRSEAERADESARRKADEMVGLLEENEHLRKSLTTLTTQLGEMEKLRESWRGKFISLQEDMGKAAREIAEDNARRIKRDQATIARQEVLDARLQAEAKTRERLEVELDRLQTNERNGMRAVNECKRLENLIGELKTENHNLEQKAMRHQREFEEARESGASEVKRTRMALQTEVDSANNHVNIIREEYEEQNSKLRADLDNLRLEVDTTTAQNEMLLEEAESSKAGAIEELRRKHQDEIEDLKARYERQVTNAQEDASKSEQHLLERLSLSASKTEHLQDRLLHMEEKLEITRQAAAAAAAAAKTAGVEPSPAVAAAVVKPVQPTQQAPAQSSRSTDLPEKISPQALRESIMVLQEQLQAREQRIEELEQNLAKMDPEAETKISKRDDEISWLRELLSVRHENLQDIIAALQRDKFDRIAVKDAAIRLKANLQMEEQERERAMNGGSAINLPNILQNATPRVAQTIGPIAAAWGNWRKGVTNSPAAAAGRHSTPSRSISRPQSDLLGGLMTPPASGLRQTPPADSRPQPTAFSSTGRRFPSHGNMAPRARGASSSSLQSEQPGRGTPPPRQSEVEPHTPPMMRSAGYDSDAQPGDFDDNDFFEDD